MTGYFDKIFHEPIDDPLGLSHPYSVRNRTKHIDANKEGYEAFAAEAGGLSIKDIFEGRVITEALGDGQQGTSLLIDFIPDVFTQNIVQFGERESIARRDFPIISQNTNSNFKHRFKWRHDSTGLYREGDTILTATTLRDVETYAFIKLADSMTYSREFLEDSGTTLDEISSDLRLSASKQAMLYDRTAWHEFYWCSDATLFPEFNVYNFQQLGSSSSSGQSGNPTGSELLSAMEDAFITAVTRQEDPLTPSQLKWYVAPEAWKALFKLDELRRFDITGREPQFLKSQIPSFFNLPVELVPLGQSHF